MKISSIIFSSSVFLLGAGVTAAGAPNEESFTHKPNLRSLQQRPQQHPQPQHNRQKTSASYHKVAAIRNDEDDQKVHHVAGTHHVAGIRNDEDHQKVHHVAGIRNDDAADEAATSPSSNNTVWTATVDPPLVSFGGNPPAENMPLSVCHGDCDYDGDCQPGLVCFRRIPFDPVPGCTGLDSSNTDYCIKPALEFFGSDPPAEKLPLGLCEGDCDDDSQCESGLVCFQREADEVVPGCRGNDGSRSDYCVEPTMMTMEESTTHPAAYHIVSSAIP